MNIDSFRTFYCYGFAIFLALGASALSHAGSPVTAQKIQQEFQLKSETWAMKMQLAKSKQEIEQLMLSKPDVLSYANKIWQEIRDSLAQDWTLESASWFVQATAAYAQSSEGADDAEKYKNAIDLIMQALEKHHLNSPRISTMCLGLLVLNDQKSLALLEKIASAHSDKKVQGMAAIVAALRLKKIGDEPELMKRRLTHLRKAIIESSEMKIGDTTVAEVAKDEIYIIQYLLKGRVAPELTGTDSAGKMMQLSQYKGKVVLLVFWSLNSPDMNHNLEVIDSLRKKYAQKPFVVVGVNQDSTEQLRSLQGNGSLTWDQFTDPKKELSQVFRVSNTPWFYILDKDLKIQFSGATGVYLDLSLDAILSAS